MDAVTRARTPALIEIMDAHGRVHAQHRLLNAGATCRIGRSLECDLIVDDPYAAPEHASITLLEDGRVSISDLGGRNGTRITSGDASHRLSAASMTVEGAQLIVGRTKIKVRTQIATLAPERLFRRDLLRRHRTVLASIGVVLVLALAAADVWLREIEQYGPKILTAMLAATIALALWIGLWALITRIGHGVWNLRIHVAIASNMIALALVADAALTVVSFASQLHWLEPFGLAIGVGALLVALYLHLRTATHLPARTAVIVSVAVPLALSSAATWVYLQNEARNVNRVELGAEVLPSALQIAHSVNADRYFAEINDLKQDADRKRQQSLLDSPIASAQ